MANWTTEQLNNARIIQQVGQSVGASPRDIQIALMAAWQESGLRNLSYGDRDSVGLFQQRNAWAPLATRMNARESAKMFFLGGQQGQKGLLDFANRNQYSLGQAAQKVQVSAYPDAYDKWQSTSADMLKELGVSPGVQDTTTPTTPESPTETLPGLLGAPTQVQPTALGIDAASVAPDSSGPLGLGSMSAIGVESADQQPNYADMFLPQTGAGGFDEVFPKTGVVGGTRSRVVDFAKTLLGTPYKWGGTDPQTGLDCSGFVQLALKQVGVQLPRISAQQAAYGQRTAIGSLQPGDLVAWDNSKRNNGADHIAIYMGNGQIIEEPRPGYSVRIRTLDSDEGAYGVSLNY